jgi:eukaryotic-like serine/threonine-protein kinase
LGESLVTVQKFDVPLAEATTPSLEALKAYSLGARAFRETGNASSLPYHLRAVELDPNFAMGYEAVGQNYFGLGELGRASVYFTRAFEMREHTSEREKLRIISSYYENVTGELEKSAQDLQEDIENYPRDFSAHNALGLVYAEQGQYDKAADEYSEDIRLALQRFDEARRIIQQMQARKLDDFIARQVLYALAFLKSDAPAMAEQQQWFAGKSRIENFGLSLASDTEAYAGHLGKARQMTKQSVESAIRADGKEGAALWNENGALREAAFGEEAEARQAAIQGLILYPASQAVQVEAALAFAMAGDAVRSESLAQDLNKRFPLHTQMQSLWLPAIRAQVALDRKNSSEAVSNLQTVVAPIELGQIYSAANISCLYPTYIRGQAYLAGGQGKEAAAEFQKIIDHSGIVWNCWTGALAHLGVARANALQSKTFRGQGQVANAYAARARAAYKDFLTLWKDADPDIPILKEAKAEYAKLQ